MARSTDTIHIVAEERAIMPALKATCEAILRVVAPLMSDLALYRLINLLARATVWLGVRVRVR